MPGIRDKNLRSGDLHEDLGIYLLKQVALVAPIPRQEDVGNDAFVTLIRPEGSRRLIPDLSFLVQLKSASVASVTYKTSDEVAWISALDVPLFIGRVDRELARIELFTTQRLHQIMLERCHEEIELLLDPGGETSAAPNLRRANLGPPIHAWSMADVSDTGFLARSYSILRPHIDTLRRNRWLRGIQSQMLLRWETGQPPTDNGEMMLVSPQNDIADTLREMAPHARRMLLELQYRKRYRDFPVMLAFFDLMRRWGADPDPEGILRMVAGHTAEGPEISVEEAILIRHAFQPSNSLDLSRLPLTNEALAVIPDTVTGLAIVDTPVTDACIHHLLRLTGIKRLNIAGTQISDDGLAALEELENLEWVCVNRTQVTNAGVNRLKVTRPNVTVLIEAEPGKASATR
ncbi:MAG: hypothetical protein AB1424_09080 [Thermodesulfobacteriota bacterium]